MALSQAKSILAADLSPLSVLKMLVMTAGTSHPTILRLCNQLLRPFTDDGEIAIRYFCYGRSYVAFVRTAELESDRMSVFELAVKRIYPVAAAFNPDLVIDGGGNTGLYTLLASAMFPSAKIVVCEPVPHNLLQIEKHLRLNHVDAEILPVCIGGTGGSIDFYVREANQSSFDPGIPYRSRIEVEVVTLPALLRESRADRILIKLDIEGMEVDAMESLVPSEARPVIVVGEVHNAGINVGRLQRICEMGRWGIRFEGLGAMTGNFIAWSPAADSMLGGLRQDDAGLTR